MGVSSGGADCWRKGSGFMVMFGETAGLGGSVPKKSEGGSQDQPTQRAQVDGGTATAAMDRDDDIVVVKPMVVLSKKCSNVTSSTSSFNLWSNASVSVSRSMDCETMPGGGVPCFDQSTPRKNECLRISLASQ